MKIIKVGHSEIHPRQNLLTLEIAKDMQNVEIMSFSPKVWGDEIAPKHVVGLDIFVPEEQQQIGFNNIMLRGLEISAAMHPDIIWVDEEPSTFLAWQCRNIAKNCGANLVVFTWENKENLRFPGVFGEIEKQILTEADLVICGNSGAEKRVHSIEQKAKTIILPQTGVNVDLFKPMPEVKKLYDIGSFGRFVEEKIGQYNNLLQMRPNLKSLTVGGRGNIRPVSGTVLEWQSILDLPLYYNSLNCFLSLPYNHNGYNEQFNYTIAEALACGITVITSDNGSIPEIYENVPNLFLVEEGNKSVGQSIYYLEGIVSEFTKEEREDLSIRGREWVIENLSLQTIAKKYIKIFEELLNNE